MNGEDLEGKLRADKGPLSRAAAKVIRDYRILAEGCARHPAYRAKRPASGNCAPCAEMWAARQRLRGVA